MPMDQIEFNVRKQMEESVQKRLSMLGPLVTDIAPGYDHITVERRWLGGMYSNALLRDAKRTGCKCRGCGAVAAHAFDSHGTDQSDRDDELQRRYN